MESRDYRAICDRLCRTMCTSNELDIFKEQFRSRINSERLMDNINSLRFLITILERRDIISYENFDCLNEIINVLKINPTNHRHLESPNINRYNDDFEFQIIENRRATQYSPVLPPVSHDAETRVFDLICTEIGKNWKDLARALEIPEGNIDLLECNYRGNLRNAVYEILKYHKEMSDPVYWKIRLSEGLQKARRSDLSRKVQEQFALGTALNR